MPSSLLRTVLVLAAATEASGGRVKQALFGSLFGSKRDHVHADTALADAEQAELVEFLKTFGFGKYASKEYIEMLDEELAYDSIEDMTHLVADDDYSEIKMPFDDAMEIQKLARREMLKRFLTSVPRPSGEAADIFEKHLDALIAAGYDEPDDVADLEEDEAQKMGISLEHVRILVPYAEEYETRLLMHLIVTTHTDAAGGTPYSTEAAWRPLIDAIVKAGVRSLADLAQLAPDAAHGIPAKHLAALQSDPRVQRHAPKQEL